MVDFFVSYNGKDKAWAEWIAWQLEEAGYTTVIQAWDFRPSGNFVIDMQNAAAEAKRTIAVLSQNYLNALYTQSEWAAAFKQDPTGEKKKLLPVRIAKCNVEGVLAPIVYIDLVGKSEAEAQQILLEGVKEGRVKPTTAPGFPGSKIAVPHTQPEKPGFPPHFLLRKPSWKFAGGSFAPGLPYTPLLANYLKQYDPFAAHRAEDDLAFLFGAPVGFWPDHPLFYTISRQPETVDVIRAEPGAGKTAFAYGLVHVGDGVNHHPCDVLPVYLPGILADEPGIRRAIRTAMRQFVAQNSGRYQNLPLDLDQENWLDSLPEALDSLGFRKVLLVLDFCDHAALDHLTPCLKNLRRRQTFRLVTKLLAPATASIDVGPFEVARLTWDDHQLRSMADWRFQSVTKIAGVRFKGLSSLFEAGVYHSFFIASKNNPRRLAKLWRELYQDHVARTPDLSKFTADNLKHAQEKL